MGPTASAWRRVRASAAVLLVLAWAVLFAAPVMADISLETGIYRCDGALIRAALHGGAVDDPAIPNRNGSTLPGAYMVLQGPDLHLQLPRTNNAGAPSFSDGKWWWSLEDPDHPTFLMRRGRGDSLSLLCERMVEPSTL